MVDFHNQHVIITGGSSGIGRAMARLFVQRGAHVSILARRQAVLDETLAELEGLRSNPSQRLVARSVDVTDGSVLEQTIDALMEGGYSADILVNAAGVVHVGRFEDIEMSDFYRTVEIDLYGTVNAVRAVVPTMVERKKGHIVNFSSVLGFAASYGYTAYSAAKFGVRGFSDALRHELRPHDIHVSCVFPQDTDTPQLQQEREMQPLEARRISEGANRVLDAHKVARSIIRDMERRRKNILPGLKIKVFFPVIDGPQFLSAFIGWYFIDRIVARVRREIESSTGGAGSQDTAA